MLRTLLASGRISSCLPQTAGLHVMYRRVSLVLMCGATNPGIGEEVEIAPDYVIWRDMNIVLRKDADAETRQFAVWLRSDETVLVLMKYGWVRKTTQ